MVVNPTKSEFRDSSFLSNVYFGKTSLGFEDGIQHYLLNVNIESERTAIEIELGPGNWRLIAREEPSE